MVGLLAIILGSMALTVAGSIVWASGIGTNQYGRNERYELIISGFIMVLVFAMATLVFGVMWGTTYLGSYNDVQRLSAFQNETMSAYQYTVDRTESVVIDANKTRDNSFTDFTYQEQGKAVSERIMEMRDAISQYNRELYDLRGKNRLPVIGAMYKDVPDDLKPIKLGSLP